MDECDLAQREQERDLQRSIQNHNNSKQQMQAVGICHWCADAVEDGLFCDADCRDDFVQNERKNGRHFK